MSEIIKAPKKERKFLKTLGKIGEVLLQEVIFKIGSNLIKKIGGKKNLPSLLFLFFSLSACAQYPATGNKQRLGFQTTGDGLVYRGRAADTVSIKSSGLNNAYFILDTVNNIVYNYIKTKGGWQFSNGDTIIINNNFAQPVDSLFFKTSVATNNVDTAKMRWNSDLGTVVLGMYDQVPNELGFKNFWLVKNQTGSTITKGSIVYANGTVGASGRITVAKFIANGSIESKYVLGITAHDLTDGEDGYVISYGKIRQVNTDTFAAGAILYPSPTVAGVWTDLEPVAPNIDMPIGFCINSHANNGTIAIRVASGYNLHELHDVAITSPVDRASLYYRSGLWRDTTATLLTSDTASMLTNYLKSSVNLTSQVTGILPLLNGGTGSDTQNGARTNLGGTSIGQYLFTLTNGSTNKYARFDANNQVTLLTSSELRTDIGAGVGSVTSVGMTVPTLLSITGSPITTSGTLALTYSGTALPILNGGTGATTISQARVNLQVPNISTTITPQAPLTGGGSLAGDRTISIPVATSIANGYLSSADFVTFNAKGNGTVTNVSASGTPNGLSVATGTTTPVISMALAASGTIGVVSATTQTFSGSKTFANDLATSGAFSASGFSTLTGGVSVGTMATQANLTHVLGVDASNNIGELGLGVGMSVGSGVLSVQAAGASQSGLVTTLTQTFGGNKTFNGTVTLASATGTATSVIGRSSTGQVVDVTLGSGLNLSAGGTLSATAGNDINVYLAINGPGIILSSSFGVYSHWYVNINQASTVTITLPSASGNPYKTLYIKNSGTGAVNSNATNVEPLNSTTLSTVILTSGGGKYATLVSNGTNWIKMSGN